MTISDLKIKYHTALEVAQKNQKQCDDLARNNSRSQMEKYGDLSNHWYLLGNMYKSFLDDLELLDLTETNEVV